MNGRSGATGSNSLNIRVASCLALILTAYLSNVPCRAAELVMFETPGCTWCAAWDAEIGRVYPLTDEGKAAPLAASIFRNHVRTILRRSVASFIPRPSC